MQKLSNKQKVLIALFLLLFAGGKLLLLKWWHNRQPAPQAVVVCDVRVGCTLPNGAKVQFRGLGGAKTPFDVLVQGVNVHVASVSFSMRDMDMGFNRYELRRQADGSWQALQIRLPLCVQGRHDYLADVKLGDQVFQVGFEAQ